MASSNGVEPLNIDKDLTKWASKLLREQLRKLGSIFIFWQAWADFAECILLAEKKKTVPDKW